MQKKSDFSWKESRWSFPRFHCCNSVQSFLHLLALAAVLSNFSRWDHQLQLEQSKNNLKRIMHDSAVMFSLDLSVGPALERNRSPIPSPNCVNDGTNHARDKSRSFDDCDSCRHWRHWKFRMIRPQQQTSTSGQTPESKHDDTRSIH